MAECAAARHIHDGIDEAGRAAQASSGAKVEVGKTAVKYALAGETSGSVAMRRTGDGANYGIECFRAELKDVARETKSIVSLDSMVWLWSDTPVRNRGRLPSFQEKCTRE